MARKTSPRTVPTATPRHLWLAGLGFVTIAGRRTVKTAGLVARRVVRVREDAAATLQEAKARASTTTSGLKDRIEASAARLNGVVEQAISPLIARLKPAGKPKRAVRRGRKSVAKNARRAAPKSKMARRTGRG